MVVLYAIIFGLSDDMEQPGTTSGTTTVGGLVVQAIFDSGHYPVPNAGEVVQTISESDLERRRPSGHYGSMPPCFSDDSGICPMFCTSLGQTCRSDSRLLAWTRTYCTLYASGRSSESIARAQAMPRAATARSLKGTLFGNLATSASLQTPSMHLARKCGKCGGLEHFLFFHILGIIIPTD